MFDLSPDELAATAYAGLAADRLAFDAAADRELSRRGWTRRGHELGRPFPGHGLRVAAEFLPGPTFTLGRVKFLPAGTPPGPFDDANGTPLGAVPAALRCEVFADLRTLSGRRPG